MFALRYGAMLRRGWLKSLPCSEFYCLVVINASFLLINNLPSIDYNNALGNPVAIQFGLKNGEMMRLNTQTDQIAFLVPDRLCDDAFVITLCTTAAQHDVRTGIDSRDGDCPSRG